MMLLLIAVGAPAAQRPATELIGPRARITFSSGAPDPRGDGAVFTGNGFDALLSAGVQGSFGRLEYGIMPELVFGTNGERQTFPSGDPARDPFASPFYHGRFSADLPSRPGAGRYVRLAPGESGVWWTGQRAFIGLLSATPRWGPDAFGEGLVLGESAPGLPRLEAAYAWRPTLGTLRLRWFGGIASESQWFDADERNDSRVVAGARLELVRGDRFAAGLGRTVMSAGGRPKGMAALQPFTRGTDSTIDMLSADLVLRDSRSGTMVWLELLRQAPLGGAGQFARQPTEGLALRGGLEQRLARTEAATWVGTIEFVRLSQAGTNDGVVPNDLYTSPTVVHGWTHHGQPLGAGLGPGGQRQFAQLARRGANWRLSAFGERVRWNGDAMFRLANPASDRHDVTLQAGIAAGRRVGSQDVLATLSVGRRLNYLFQGASTQPGNEGRDLGVLRFGLSLRPIAGPSRIVGLLPGA